MDEQNKKTTGMKKNIRKDVKKQVIKEAKKEKREAYVRGATYAVILCLVMLSITNLIYIVLRDDIYEELDVRQTEELDTMEAEIHRAIESTTTYAYHLSRFPQTKRVLEGDIEALEDTRNSMKIISEYSACIGQLRLLDTGGSEIVRVNMDSGGIGQIVPSHELQNKAGRYYFDEGLDADVNEVYISKLDLNMEHGEIEIPYNPVLRIGLPVYGDQMKLGLVLINYKAKALFDMLDSLNSHDYDEWNLVDLDGYYIYESTNEKTFGFAIDNRKSVGFYRDYPNAWEQIQLSETGKQIVHDGWLYYKKVSPISNPKDLSIDRYWYLIMKVPQVAVDKELEHLVLGLQIGNGVLVPLFIVLGWFLGTFQIRNKQYRAELEKQARVDPLTGLYNRRHINDLLRYNTDLANRQGGELSLVYVDINDLKLVNDKYGHDTGDAMIKFASQAMMNSVRKTDIVARMGGDEFMIVFPDCSREQLNIIMERIAESFKAEGLRTLNMEWSFSWGSSHWKYDQDSIDDFINRADLEMYGNKKRFKSKS